jgi:hypothetical protein
MPRNKAVLSTIPAVDREPIKGYMRLPHEFVRYQMRYLTGSETQVYLAIYTHRDDGERSWPSARQIGRYTGLDPRTVFRATRILEQRKLIRRIRRKGTSTLYLPGCDATVIPRPIPRKGYDAVVTPGMTRVSH